MQDYTLTAEEYRAKKEAERKEILSQLEDGVKAVFSSDKYTKFLEAYAKFHNYSVGNTIMILSQKPDAERVASFTTWKRMDRHIKKGEEGIKIIVPSPYTFEAKVEGKDEPEEMTGMGFRTGYVFDISQTEGKPLPSLVTVLAEDSPEIKQVIETMVKTSDVPIYFDKPIKESSNGYYHLTEHYIAIKPNLSDTQTFKTLVHEMAHSMLHGEDTEHLSAYEREVQAESVAYVVCHKYGVDTSDYSFGYIAVWSENKDMKELKSSLDTIGKCADQIIEKIDKALGLEERELPLKQAQGMER